jgi:hypothetical protein
MLFYIRFPSFILDRFIFCRLQKILAKIFQQKYFFEKHIKAMYQVVTMHQDSRRNSSAKAVKQACKHFTMP